MIIKQDYSTDGDSDIILKIHKLIEIICYKQLMTIKYLEDKFYRSKNDITTKLIERRREDVRDQMKELSNSKPQLLMNQEETIQDEARQRRSAEREVRNQIFGNFQVICGTIL